LFFPANIIKIQKGTLQNVLRAISSQVFGKKATAWLAKHLNNYLAALKSICGTMWSVVWTNGIWALVKVGFGKSYVIKLSYGTNGIWAVIKP
jgi:hypothetical protein